MKYLSNNIILTLICIVLATTSCSKFEEINQNPTAATADQVQVEYFINNAIVSAQQDPHIAERVFVLYWKTAARQHLTTGIAGGTYDDGWSSDYFRYASEWLNHINTAIQIAGEKEQAGIAQPYNNNLKQVARIWRVYLMSELCDNFGPVPITAFQGTNPEFNTVKDVYYFMLDELKDAVAKFNTATPASAIKKYDQAYEFDFDKWKRYANSMRLRLAMRLSEVEPAKAKAEFESAASTNLFISLPSHNFSVLEKGGWSPLSGVMSRPWNAQVLSTTINNLYLGLGGITSVQQLPADYHFAVKPANYIGKRLLSHYTTKTNDPSAGFWLDGLPGIIDPRAYKTFIMPGDFSNSNFFGNTDPNSLNFTLPAISGVTASIPVNTKFTWNSFVIGNWGAKGALNTLRGQVAAMPVLANKFRTSTNKRIFFANWETYFLLAEAAERGWAVPMSGQAAYEAGIDASMEYWGVSGFSSVYKASQDYNRAGTSVSWTHVTEPGATFAMNYTDGYTNTTGVYNMTYGKNDLYKNGTIKNDHLTKIITQKYLAQVPWLPLEGWNDKRRLGLPFFENPTVEDPNINLPALNSSNYMTSKVEFFPQRLPYPSSFRNSDPANYAKAINMLGGDDKVFTPLWWAKH